MNTIQKNAFITYEADAWFQRNSGGIKNYSGKDDHLINLLIKYNISPLNILEIGCSAGYRLDALQKTFPSSKVSGIEPSQAAIDYGNAHYKNINFTRSTADDLSIFDNQQFDLVIVGFVFYVVDRTLLFKCIAEVDRVLKDKGFLVIKDFFSETPRKRKYQHINDVEAFSYKQDYETPFINSHLYQRLHQETFNHDSSLPDANVDYQNLYSISLLKKDLDASYR